MLYPYYLCFIILHQINFCLKKTLTTKVSEHHYQLHLIMLKTALTNQFDIDKWYQYSLF